MALQWAGFQKLRAGRIHLFCPKCHHCPGMGGAVLPMCWGTVIGHGDDLDLSYCTCDPADPDIAKADLAFRAHHLLTIIRHQRRNFSIDTRLIQRLIHVAQFAPFARPQEQRESWAEVLSIGLRMAGRENLIPLRNAVGADLLRVIPPSSPHTKDQTR